MNCRAFFCCFVISLACFANLIAADDESIDATIFSHFCAAQQPPSSRDVDEYFCECSITASPLVGLPELHIDCTHIANLTNKLFGAEKLPPNAASLVLSYQLFTKIPEFVGEALRHLDMSYNRIVAVKNLNFIRVKHLSHLDLQANAISSLEPNAFAMLDALTYLDLSSNQLVDTVAHVFSPLVRLVSVADP